MNYAGFWIRFAAHMVDSIILAIPGLIVGGSVRTFSAGLSVNLVLALLYYPIFESSELKCTPGKSLFNLAVTSESGDQLTFKQALVRFFTRYISMLIMYIGYLMQPFNSRRQTLHDMISESVVTHQPVLDKNYFTVWKNQLKAIIASI